MNEGQGEDRQVVHLCAVCDAFSENQSALRVSALLQVSTQALFGVGAPEAVLVGVVALVVFGPKGLAEASPHCAATCRSAPCKGLELC